MKPGIPEQGSGITPLDFIYVVFRPGGYSVSVCQKEWSPDHYKKYTDQGLTVMCGRKYQHQTLDDAIKRTREAPTMRVTAFAQKQLEKIAAQEELQYPLGRSDDSIMYFCHGTTGAARHSYFLPKRISNAKPFVMQSEGLVDLSYDHCPTCARTEATLLTCMHANDPAGDNYEEEIPLESGP